jgi:peptidyl-prolyl cis-trans isomerase C
MIISLFRFAVRALAIATPLTLGTMISGTTGFSQDTAQPAPAIAPETVLATVNGKPITEAELQLALSELDQQFSRLPPEQQRAAAMSTVIQMKLLAAKAETDGLGKTPEFERRIEFLRERTLYAMVVDTEIAGKITEEEIRARYNKEIAAAPPVNEVKARHILVKTKEEGVDIVKQLDGGADFEKLANERTNDPSGKTSGGDLGWFGPGQMVPEFEKAAFALKVGEYTKSPVETQFGWHVIKAEDKRLKQAPAFEQVSDQVRSLLVRERYFALVKAIRDAAKVDITDPALKTGVEQIEKGR